MAFLQLPGNSQNLAAPLRNLQAPGETRSFRQSPGRRIAATPRTERLFDLYKIYVLAGRPGSAEASYVGPRSPVDALPEKYARDILDIDSLRASASDDQFAA